MTEIGHVRGDRVGRFRRWRRGGAECCRLVRSLVWVTRELAPPSNRGVRSAEVLRFLQIRPILLGGVTGNGRRIRAVRWRPKNEAGAIDGWNRDGASVLLTALGLLLELLASLLGGLLAVLLTALLSALLTAGLLLSLGQELAGLGITGTLLGDLAHLPSELLGVSLVLGTLVGTPTLLAGEPRLLAGGLLLSRDVSLLLLWGLGRLLCLLLALLPLLCGLLAHLTARLLSLLDGLLAHLLSGLLRGLLGTLLTVLLAALGCLLSTLGILLLSALLALLPDELPRLRVTLLHLRGMLSTPTAAFLLSLPGVLSLGLSLLSALLALWAHGCRSSGRRYTATSVT